MEVTLKRILSIAVSAALVLASGPLHALEVQVQIRKDVSFRQVRAGHRVIGVLRAGSIISIDLADGERQNHPNPNRPGYDQFDLHKTLQYMQANPRAGAVSSQTISGVNTSLFKVKVVRKAPGSSVYATAGTATMIPLASMESSGNTYVNTGGSSAASVTTGTDTPVYDGSDDSQDQTACPDGSCDTQAGPLSQSQIDAAVSIVSGANITASDDSDDDDDDGSTGGSFQGLKIPGKPLCNRFIKTDGSYGDYGVMLKGIFAKMPDYQNKTATFAAVCPNFASFSKDERLHFQIWAFAAAASVESGCSSDAINHHAVPGHGPAVGLMQVEGYPGQRARAGRGPMCSPGVDVDMTDDYRNLSCAAEMIDDGLISKNYSLERRAGLTGQYYAALGNSSFKVTSKGRKKHRRTRHVPNPTRSIISSYRDCWN